MERKVSRPEWWVRRAGVTGVKRFVPDRVMRAWEQRGSSVVQWYVPACSQCLAIAQAALKTKDAEHAPE